MYDPIDGRWTTRDPEGFAAGDVNLYRYVGDHPTNATDPTGLEEVPVRTPAQGTIGTIAVRSCIICHNADIMYNGKRPEDMPQGYQLGAQMWMRPGPGNSEEFLRSIGKTGSTAFRETVKFLSENEQEIRLICGIAEAGEGVVLLLAPEPSGVSKVGGVILLLHGADTIDAALQSNKTGRNVPTLTQTGVTKLAKEAGADEKTANLIGMAVDAGIPLAVNVVRGGVNVRYLIRRGVGGKLELIEESALLARREQLLKTLAREGLDTEEGRAAYREFMGLSQRVGKLLGHNEYVVSDAAKAAKTKESLLNYYKLNAKNPSIVPVDGLAGAEIDTVTGKIRIGKEVLERYPHLADGYLVEELRHFQVLHQQKLLGRALTSAEEAALEQDVVDFMARPESGFKVFDPRK